MIYEVHHQNCLDYLPCLDGKVDCIFADPPDGIGLGYAEYDDKASDIEYYFLLSAWVNCFVRKAHTTWFSFNAKWTVTMGYIVSQLQSQISELEVKPMVQTFTFGQHNKHDFGNNHRPLWRFRWPDAPIYPEQIKVPSWRQLHGDKRAAPGGRVPGDVFDFPRVTGNAKQRRKWHPTQLHEGLVARCIESCTRIGNMVIDPFAGTGTTLRVCKALERSCVTMDLDRTYCEKIAKENGISHIL
jgi:site-specific DNA-methyltransferase (adenine-specific)